jgi:hypothetical protein
MGTVLGQGSWTYSEWGAGVFIVLALITAVIAFMTWWGHRKSDR